MKLVRKQAEMAARRERWSQVVEQAEASGLSIRQFCEQHSVDEGQLYHWRHRLELEGAQRTAVAPAKPEFVLVPAPGAPAQAEAAVLVGRGVDETALRVALDALARQA